MGDVFRVNSSVHAGIDLSKPEGGVEFRRLVENWFCDAVRELGGSALDPFAHSLDLTGRGAGLRRSGVPLGTEGELWGSLWLTRVLKSGRKLTGNVWSPKNWQKFLQEVEKFPLEAELSLSLLGADGYPGSPWIAIKARRDYDAPDWVSLMVDRSSENFLQQQSVWVGFLERQADSLPAPLFGCIADDMSTTTHRTAFESATGKFQDETLATLDRTLRGYSWLTICSRGVADRLGGIQAICNTEAFTQVKSLPGGALMLRATHDFEQYDGEHVERVFNALRAVLPSSVPRRFISDRYLRLFFQDGR